LLGALPVSAAVFVNLSDDHMALNVSGSGTESDPYVLDEVVSSASSQWSIGVKGLGRQSNSQGSGVYIVKRITNNTRNTWRMRNAQVEVGFGTGKDGHDYGKKQNSFASSPNGDGLSFAEGQTGRVTDPIVNVGDGFFGHNGSFGSNEWDKVFLEEKLDRDFVQFFGHSPSLLDPGETLELRFRITDNFGDTRGSSFLENDFVNADFILWQRLNASPQAVPEPATMLALAGGLGWLAGRRRRKS
jgi:hypothetical protein